MNTVFTKDSDLQPYPWLRVLLGFAAGMFIFLFISRVVDFAIAGDECRVSGEMPS